MTKLRDLSPLDKNQANFDSSKSEKRERGDTRDWNRNDAPSQTKKKN